AGVHRVDQPDEADVLYDRGGDTAVDRLSKQGQCVRDLVWFDERIQREVDANATRRGDRARSLQLIECKLRALIAGVEALGAEVDRVGAVRHRRPDGIERAGRGEQFGGATV